MVDEIRPKHCRQVALGNRHPDRVGQALAQRAGRGLDARRNKVLGMAGRDRAELAKALDLFDGHLLVAEEMQHRIEQHRTMAGREHEAVTIGPSRVGRVESQKAREQHGGDIGRPHRKSGMARFRLLDRIHRERPNGVRHPVVRPARRDLHARVTGGRGYHNPRRVGGERNLRIESL